MLSVRGRGALQRLRQVGRRCVHRDAGDTPRQPRRDLLQQPAVAVGIAEGDERTVAAMLGIRTADPEPPKQVGLVRASVHAAGVEYLGRVDAVRDQFVARSLDVGDDQV